MNDLELYKATWKDIGEKLAYISFTGPAYDILESRGCTYEDIEKFNVIIFCPTYLDEKTNTEVVDFTVRFSVFLRQGEEITFLFNNKIISDALVAQIYKKEFGVFQQYNFEYPRPNAMELFDAEYYLIELLNL
jgi:hypothetical protein